MSDQQETGEPVAKADRPKDPKPAQEAGGKDSGGQDAKADAELALKRFDILSRYLAYEGTVYWARSTFFLGVNAGLFGLLATLLKDSLGTFHVVATAVSLLGMLLSVLWLLALLAGEHWTSRWEALCVEYEPGAFGETEVFRNGRSTIGKLAKGTAMATVGIFITAWVISLGYQTLLHVCGPTIQGG
ncbi:RipA family octameric membrane protein [Brevundimonas poindexterae]|uniref:RipA family octameric membrane protein n=1 Tax=Brevundimonas poindexterae TaxID=74325 RepID=UPI001CFCEA0D|nr:hypothetical protein [Brevundimonas poindexterae]